MHEPTIWERLAEPFDPDTVQWRVGFGGRALAYIDARQVQDRLDEVCGPEGWQSRHFALGGPRMGCEIKIRVPETSEWIAKTDGSGETHIEPEKGAASDAFKRAAVAHGIGRYLYALSAPEVELKDNGKRIADSEYPKLQRMLERCSSERLWGGRAEKHLFNVLKNTLQSFCLNREMLQAWVDGNKGNLAQLPVRLKEELWNEVQRIKDGFEAKDAA